jgi:hypothetical protein
MTTSWRSGQRRGSEGKRTARRRRPNYRGREGQGECERACQREARGSRRLLSQPLRSPRERALHARRCSGMRPRWARRERTTSSRAGTWRDRWSGRQCERFRIFLFRRCEFRRAGQSTSKWFQASAPPSRKPDKLPSRFMIAQCCKHAGPKGNVGQPAVNLAGLTEFQGPSRGAEEDAESDAALRTTTVSTVSQWPTETCRAEDRGATLKPFGGRHGNLPC